MARRFARARPKSRRMQKPRRRAASRVSRRRRYCRSGRQKQQHARARRRAVAPNSEEENREQSAADRRVEQERHAERKAQHARTGDGELDVAAADAAARVEQRAAGGEYDHDGRLTADRPQPAERVNDDRGERERPGQTSWECAALARRNNLRQDNRRGSTRS